MTSRAALALVAAVTVGLLGCGGDDEGERAGVDKGARTETTTTATESSRPAPDRDERASDGDDDAEPSEPPPTEPERAAPSSPAGLPSKQQRDAAADSVCRTREAAGQNAPPGLARLCDALREAAGADTAAEYRRALRKVLPRPQR